MPRFADRDAQSKQVLLANITVSLESEAKTINDAVASLRHRESSTIFLVGKLLIAAKMSLARHGDGTFDAWIKKNLTIGKTTAFKWRKVVEVFGDCSHCERFIEPSALYLLSQDSTPFRARRRALRRAKREIRVRLRDAAMIVDREKQRDRDNASRWANNRGYSMTNDQFDLLVELRRRFHAIWKVTPETQRLRYKHWARHFQQRRTQTLGKSRITFTVVRSA